MPKPHKSEEVSAPLWFVSFSDLMTNMLCFFVMLFAFSSLDSTKKLKDSDARDEKFHAVFTINASQGAHQWLTPGNKGILTSPSSRKSDIPLITKNIKRKLARVPLGDRMQVMSDDQVVKIQIPANVLFESGRAEMKASAEEVLTALVPIIGTIENYIRIDGHTDDLPAKSTAYPSNWELSAARACTVLRFFVEKMNLDPGRFSAQGYADNRPREKNITPETREINRRVEIVILNQKKKVIRDYTWE